MNALIVIGAILGGVIALLFLTFSLFFAIVSIGHFAGDAHEDLLLDGDTYKNDTGNKAKSR